MPYTSERCGINLIFLKAPYPQLTLKTSINESKGVLTNYPWGPRRSDIPGGFIFHLQVRKGVEVSPVVKFQEGSFLQETFPCPLPSAHRRPVRCIHFSQ